MKYKILDLVQNGETITTKVLYDFDGVELEVEVAHFAPDTVEAIEQGIINRGLSEQRRMKTVEVNAIIIKDIQIGIEKTIEIEK